MTRKRSHQPSTIGTRNTYRGPNTRINYRDIPNFHHLERMKADKRIRWVRLNRSESETGPDLCDFESNVPKETVGEGY